MKVLNSSSNPNKPNESNNRGHISYQVEEKKKPAPKKKPAKKAAPASKKRKAAAEPAEVKQATKKTKSAGSKTTYLVCDSASGGKFWECVLSGDSVTTRWGKVGSDGMYVSQ